MRTCGRIRACPGAESGMTMMETVVAVAVIALIALVFLSGLVTSSRAAFMADQRTTAVSLAQRQMESVQNTPYSDNATYSLASIPVGKDYSDYSVTMNVTSLGSNLKPISSSDNGIQKIMITVNYSGEGLFTLEGYRVKR